MRVAVLGATGYTGLVLLRILAEHPDVRGIVPVSSSHAGEPVTSIDAGLAPSLNARLTATDGKFATMDEAVALAQGEGVDVVFAALPHLKSAQACEAFLGRSVVIDLSADFRFRDSALFSRTYGGTHPRPDLLSRAVYGLAEWHADSIRTADLIANPGCYPTATLLPLLPLARRGLIEGTLVVNAISGISGAGRKERLDLLYSERTENAGAYSPGRLHRHAPEIEKELAAACPGLGLLFTPHLAPLKRGMCVSTAARLASGSVDPAAVYAESYGGRPFIRLIADRVPQSRDVWGSNRCDIGWRREGDYLLLFSAIDNLVKGASGQAVQNMNIRFGLEESAGLRQHGEL